jgi:(hydroxyamino)benzene mutase
LFGGMVTGLLVAAAMTGKIGADGKMVLGSHLNAILGSFILFGFALSLPQLKYGETGLSRIGWALIISNFANWLVTILKAFLHVHGIDATGQGANDAVFGLLTALVVLPSLVGIFYWVIGFKKT